MHLVAMLLIAIAQAGMIGLALFCMMAFYMRALTTPPKL